MTGQRNGGKCTNWRASPVCIPKVSPYSADFLQIFRRHGGADNPGLVQSRCRNGFGPHLEVSLEFDESKVRFHVKDDGPGIPGDRLTELFEPFNRLGQEAGSIEGSGIGLTITRVLVERMNGAMGVDSTVGQGSTFWFEVPISNAPLSEAAAFDTLSASDLQPPVRETHVLYVEDNAANRELMKEIFSPFPSISCSTRMNGEDGVQFAREQLPDLILMDIDLPGIDGFEALNRLKTDQSTRHIPVIAISANALPQDVLHGKRALFEAYLTKPLNVRRTLKTIFDVLNA